MDEFEVADRLAGLLMQTIPRGKHGVAAMGEFSASHDQYWAVFDEALKGGTRVHGNRLRVIWNDRSPEVWAHEASAMAARLLEAAWNEWLYAAEKLR